MKLIFVRHGETTWNAENRMQGQLDPELSAVGLRQAAVVAEALSTENVDAIYSSDLQRAYVTAEMIAAKHGLTVTKSPLLREVHLGDWQGLNTAQIEELYPQEFVAWQSDSVANRPPSAERLESVIERAGQFIDMVASGGSMGNIIIVAHGGIIRGALCSALDCGPHMFSRVKLDNVGVTVIEMESNNTHVHSVNDTCHLRAMMEPETLQEM